MSTFTVKAELRNGAARLFPTSPNPRLDAELLLRHMLHRDRAWLLTHPDSPVSPEQHSAYTELLARRAQQEPMQYILGEQEFYGLRFEVSPAVLIPRPETEHLVEAVLARLPVDLPSKVADVGTGSGAIAIALAVHRPLLGVTALDLSPPALQIARANAEAHHVESRIRFLESDLLDAVAGERFDIIASNPPYVASSEQLEEQVAKWEPPAALFAGTDGLAIYKRLIPQAWQALLPGGWLLLEIGHGQRDALAALLAEWKKVSFVDDLQGIARVAIARR